MLDYISEIGIKLTPETISRCMDQRLFFLLLILLALKIFNCSMVLNIGF
jgi:hypothetical protein